jgi:hypothetical protein
VDRVHVLIRRAGAADRASGEIGAPGVAGVLDVPHGNEEARRRFARAGQFPIDALWWTGGADAAPVPEPFTSDLAFAVETHIGWDAPGSDAADPDDAVKQISFLHASEGTSLDEFRSHYRDHVGVARAHMPALWQYRQHDVIDVIGPERAIGAGIVAISELWFRSTDDFLHRYFASPADEAEFRSHEGFLDLSKAFSFVCSSRTLGREPAPDTS